MRKIFKFKTKKTKKREAIRLEIQTRFDNDKITRMEHDLLWDLTSSGRLHTAAYYLNRPVENEDE